MTLVTLGVKIVMIIIQGCQLETHETWRQGQKTWQKHGIFKIFKNMAKLWHFYEKYGKNVALYY